MDTATSDLSTKPEAPPAERAVSSTIQTGVESIILKTTAGFLLGGLAGIVLSRTGSAGVRKGLAGLGAGVGLGSAWTRTSMDLEELLGASKK
jgi:hypothetical protein